ncbi:solute carrier organic anion transporter family member 2B1 [Chanos chanos]|uniref:Solute carrier organic anion transporter family member n=1 Tax=Chanos chanos TaxID=29144 RepID=A0A6J2WW67_CHACN|nr:solute carrier organic anion transporter family member 2B1 [Chanos chanos]
MSQGDNMTATSQRSDSLRSAIRPRSLFNSIKFFVLCHGMLQLAQLLVSGSLKSSISTIEKRYGLSSQKSGLLASFNEVGNTVLIVFVSFFGSRVHRPRYIGIGALIASLASFLIALPHFLCGQYEYDTISNTMDNSSGLCKLNAESANVTCSTTDSQTHQPAFPILLMGQLLLGIGGVPIQPFGISYIDDYASKKNSPMYLGILFTVTVIGPALGFMLGSFLLRFYVDIDKILSDGDILMNEDPRWVGAWWMGFLVAGTLLFLTSLPYFFFPREMPKEDSMQMCEDSKSEKLVAEKKQKDTVQIPSLGQFLKSFPHIALRTLRNPVYLLVVLAQVNLAAMVAGLATFMAKFIEKQFTKTASFSSLMIGAVSLPSAMLGIMAGGLIMRRVRLSVKALAIMCSIAVFVSIIFALPLLFLGCPTQRISSLHEDPIQECISACYCSDEVFNPVCGSNGVEFISPCHAGCQKMLNDSAGKVLGYENCACVGAGDALGSASPGTCGSGCAHLIFPFMVLSSLTCFVASFAHTPSFMMILRTVVPEDKSFALGIQFMLFRVLAFLPAPVLYGSAIDSTCILWGKKCGKNTSCHYYDLKLFRERFLGLQTFFVFGGLACFFLSFLVLRKHSANEEQQTVAMTDMAKQEKGVELKTPNSC